VVQAVDLYEAVLLDVFLVLSCAFLLWKHARLSALHPGTIYILFHVLVFTSRAYFVLTGARTLFAGWGHGVVPVTQAEIAWAMNLSDLALVSMTAAWIKVASDDRQKQADPGHRHSSSNQALLLPHVVRSVAVVAFPIGVAALIYFAYVPNAESYGAGKIDLGEWNSSSWTMITQSWAGLALMALIYYYGFRRLYLALMGIYLLIMAIQGFDRFRVVIPLLYLLLVWLSRTGRKWPPLLVVGAGMAIVMIILPLKTIGRMVQTGEPGGDIVAATAESITDVVAGQSGDQMVLDEFASTITLVDESARYYYGALYYPLFTLPVPRQIWADKPALNWYQRELSTTSRPMALSGMVSTLHGESYANGGILGIIIISPIVAYWLGHFYFAAMRRKYLSVYRFTYIMVACSLIQVFRDGLVALVMFTLVNMTPLVAIAILSYILWRRKRRWECLSLPYVVRRYGRTAQS
jgi:hypothetical protein